MASLEMREQRFTNANHKAAAAPLKNVQKSNGRRTPKEYKSLAEPHRKPEGPLLIQPTAPFSRSEGQ
jgi:hypothetical protein